jgi:hypothetical protein
MLIFYFKLFLGATELISCGEVYYLIQLLLISMKEYMK